MGLGQQLAILALLPCLTTSQRTGAIYIDGNTVPYEHAHYDNFNPFRAVNNQWLLLDGIGRIHNITKPMIVAVKTETDKIGAVKAETDKIAHVNSTVFAVKAETDKIANVSKTVSAVKAETDKIAHVNSIVSAVKAETDKIAHVDSTVSAVKAETDKIANVSKTISAVKAETDKIAHVNSVVSAVKAETDMIAHVNSAVSAVKAETDKIADVSKTVSAVKVETDKISSMWSDMATMKLALDNVLTSAIKNKSGNCACKNCTTAVEQVRTETVNMCAFQMQQAVWVNYTRTLKACASEKQLGCDMECAHAENMDANLMGQKISSTTRDGIMVLFIALSFTTVMFVSHQIRVCMVSYIAFNPLRRPLGQDARAPTQSMTTAQHGICTKVFPEPDSLGGIQPSETIATGTRCSIHTIKSWLYSPRLPAFWQWSCTTFVVHGPASAREWFSSRRSYFGDINIQFSNGDGANWLVVVPNTRAKVFHEIAKALFHEDNVFHSRPRNLRHRINYVYEAPLRTPESEADLDP